jgi:alpha-amylase/alpha-mannosidase (GH57 family)
MCVAAGRGYIRPAKAMIPIKFALLWHQHQPNYKFNGSFLLPWVRLHTTKDYCDMAEHLLANPKMHATVNLVPSLLEQIESYIDGDTDELLKISRLPADHLSKHEKEYLLENCFHANRRTMIERSARYAELLEMSQRKEHFEEQDYLDLVVHYALAWTGEFERRKDFFQHYIEKDRNFTEKEKQLLFDELHKLFFQAIALHKKLQDSAQVEISTTPYYHPILPLLCSNDTAREAMPRVVLPEKLFRHAAHAKRQICMGHDFLRKRFGDIPIGMWPSEGSISDEALEIMIGCGIRWTASGEAVLGNSLREKEYGDLEKYFPRKFITAGGSIVVFFRDHRLSDKIGFDYQSWSAYDAVSDFITEIKRIRTNILSTYGEEALRKACVTVILDGENCWEYYPDNGFHFLSKLYEALALTNEIETVTFSQAVGKIGVANIREVDHIIAGSWINANFKIWIGHPEKNRAWELLADAAEALRTFQITGEESALRHKQAERALMRAEGSDWFWWFGDDNHTSQQDLFDELFRSHLLDCYTHLGLPVPAELNQPIGNHTSQAVFSTMHRANG